MNNIGLIISGNLTGFSRFFTSEHANDLLKGCNIDFDYRNKVTFLKENEKVYAISFAKNIVTISLITRILDSFRRPGILDITAVIPRKTKIKSLKPSSTCATFRLLNEVNDLFYEKNFVNGMLNQNPSVLMQNYYVEILQQYTLENDNNQPAVNNSDARYAKNCGYIQSSVLDIPKYLDTIVRKSYEGYDSIFIGSEAPANIEEPPVEVIHYDVIIENNNRNFPQVTLKDYIPNIQPQDYEEDFNKNYTYEQILEGNCNQIDITRKDQTLYLKYRFHSKEVKISFRYTEDGSPIDVSLIEPNLQDESGKRFKLPSDNYTFQGKEIKSKYTIICGNSKYRVKPGYESLDVSRFENGSSYNVIVEKCVAPIMPKREEPESYHSDTKIPSPREQNGAVIITANGNTSTTTRTSSYNGVVLNDESTSRKDNKPYLKFILPCVLLVFLSVLYLTMAWLADWPPFQEKNTVETEVGNPVQINQSLSISLIDKDNDLVMESYFKDVKNHIGDIKVTITREEEESTDDRTFCTKKKNDLKWTHNFPCNSYDSLIIKLSVYVDEILLCDSAIIIRPLGTDEVHDIVLNINAKSSDLKKYLKAKYHKEYNFKTTDKEFLLEISNGELKQKAEEFLSDVIVEDTETDKKTKERTSTPNETEIPESIYNLIKEAEEIGSKMEGKKLTDNQKGIIRKYDDTVRKKKKLDKNKLETCRTYEKLNEYLDKIIGE